jgi:hypothetical protein
MKMYHKVQIHGPGENELGFRTLALQMKTSSHTPPSRLPQFLCVPITLLIKRGIHQQPSANYRTRLYPLLNLGSDIGH